MQFLLSFFMYKFYEKWEHSVKKHDMHIQLKTCNFKILGKLVAQHGIRPWFHKRLGVREVLLDMNPNYVCFSTCGYEVIHKGGY